VRTGNRVGSVASLTGSAKPGPNRWQPAARDLSLSPSAISHQIRGLEEARDRRIATVRRWIDC
jgi:hypothetical protein